MFNETDGIVRIVLSVLLFPMSFQETLIRFAWGLGDHAWLTATKRLFLLLPTGALVLACWASILSVLSIPLRSNRREFITAFFITWWDLGKSVLLFWGGIFQFAIKLLVTTVAVARMMLFALASLVYDIFQMPVSVIRHLGQTVVRSPIPWIAVTLTLMWCVVETTIFTYVMSPVVIDTFSNITGETLSTAFIRVPLFLFLFFVVMGSYAVLSTFVDSFKGKAISSIIGIGVVEIVVLFVEVVFLYREFVDSLVPWFAQYSSTFELSMFWTLAISCFVWFGIRSLSWFLFAAHGTPTIMAVIQGRGIRATNRAKSLKMRFFEVSEAHWRKNREESAWIRAQGEDLLASLMLPPLQIVAAAFNFCTLCAINTHLFALPFKNMEAIRYSEKLVKNYKQKSGFQPAGSGPAPVQATREYDLDASSEFETAVGNMVDDVPVR